MKIVSDFDGVLTDQTEEAMAVRRCFAALICESVPGSSVEQVEREFQILKDHFGTDPLTYGWCDQGAVSAFYDEDYFIFNNAVAAALDLNASKLPLGRLEILENAVKKVAGKTAFFQELSQRAFEQEMKKVFDAKKNAIEPRAQQFLRDCLKAGHEVVIVSNSSTERIERMLSESGIAGIRVLGNARKFTLEGAPEFLNWGGRKFSVNRGHYRAILSRELPDVVIGDVFSLDLSLPVALRKSGVLKPTASFYFRKRVYSPEWITGTISQSTNGVQMDRVQIIDELQQVLAPTAPQA